jgi:amphiphysin
VLDASGLANSAAAAKTKSPAPPPPKPKPQRLSGAAVVETVTALYDYEAQAHGDLSFSTGDVIEIVRRTNNENEWWIGKINGRQGQYPGTRIASTSLISFELLSHLHQGNYVRLNH